MARMLLACIFQLALLASLASTGLAIYCDDEDCYEVLGVSNTATPQEIRKAYIKLSLKFHPDKNPDPSAEGVFAKIANAYEILYDEQKREQYDYALAHPEQYFYNTARYYQAYYQPKAAGWAGFPALLSPLMSRLQISILRSIGSKHPVPVKGFHPTETHGKDLRAVLVGVLLLLSAFQYLNDWIRYTQALEHAKQTPAYKNRIKSLEAERLGSSQGKRKGSKNKFRTDALEGISSELELQIHGAEKPAYWRLVGVRFVLLPYTLVKLLQWQYGWIRSYWVTRRPYSWNDAAYLTRVRLGMFPKQWQSIDVGERDRLIGRRLWIGRNLEAFRNEARKESRRRR